MKTIENPLSMGKKPLSLGLSGRSSWSWLQITWHPPLVRGTSWSSGSDGLPLATWDIISGDIIGMYIVYTLWLFNIAMENGPFIDGLPI